MNQAVCPSCGQPLELAPGDSLAACPGCRSTVVVPGSRDLPLLTASEGEAPRKVGKFTIPPSILGQYHLEKLLGSGAAGMVFTATQVATGRRVAVKFLLKLDERTLARFHSEARLLAMMSHPNVFKIFDFGNADGHPYLVGELLEGGTLRARMRSAGRIPPQEAVAVAEAALAGLEECHRSDIVHRDLKPENILFTEDGVPKIVDLGLAKFFGQDSTVTQTGALTGTPRYMAPEQIRGETVSAATDVYAMGLIIHEMLSGRPVCGGSNVGAILRMHLNETPASIREIVPEVPEGLAAAIHSALAKSPAERPSSAAAFARSLRDGLKVRRVGRPSRPVTAGRPAARGRGRGPARVAGALLVVGAGILGALATVRHVRPGASPSPAVTGRTALANPGQIAQDLLAITNAEENWRAEGSSIDRLIFIGEKPDFGTASAATTRQVEEWTARWESLKRSETALAADCPDPERCPGRTFYLLARVRAHALLVWCHLKYLGNRLDQIRYAASSRVGPEAKGLVFAAYEPRPQGPAGLSVLTDLRLALGRALGWADRNRRTLELVHLLDDTRRVGDKLRQIIWSRPAQETIESFEHDLELGGGLTPPLGEVTAGIFAWGLRGASAAEQRRSIETLREGLLALKVRYPADARWPFEHLASQVDRELRARAKGSR